MAEVRNMRSILEPKVDPNKRITAGESLPHADKSTLKQYSVYLPPEHMKWLKQQALGEDTNVSRLLTRIVGDAIASKRYDTREA